MNTPASIKKAEYRSSWEKECVQPIEHELYYCLTALLSLDGDKIAKHENYIRMKLWEIYTNFYEQAKSTVASEMRKAICRIDEVLYLKKVKQNTMK